MNDKNDKSDENQTPTEMGGEKPSVEPRTVQSEELLQGAREIRIEHEGETYRLLVTRNEKLILQK